MGINNFDVTRKTANLTWDIEPVTPPAIRQINPMVVAVFVLFTSRHTAL